MLTLLEAVNAILRNLGTSSVTSLDNISNPDVQAALDSIDTKRKAVQSTSWWFNTQENVTLAPTLVGEINVPPTTAQVVSESYDLVQHGTRLFNRADNTYIFESSITDIWLVYVLEWDDLPYSAREVIQYSAMYQTQSDLEGDQEKLVQIEGQLQGAFLTMKREHTRNRKVNAFSNARSAQLLLGPRNGNNNPYRIGG